MTKNDPRKALGKGLHSLLPTTAHCTAVPDPGPAAAVAEGDVQRLPIEQVTPNPNQPRRDFDEAALLELTQSIEREGIIQPIIVRKTAPHRVSDHRRRTPLAGGEVGGTYSKFP